MKIYQGLFSLFFYVSFGIAQNSTLWNVRDYSNVVSTDIFYKGKPVYSLLNKGLPNPNSNNPSNMDASCRTPFFVSNGKNSLQSVTPDAPDDIQLIVQFSNPALSRIKMKHTSKGKANIATIQSVVNLINLEHAQFQTDIVRIDALYQSSFSTLGNTKIRYIYTTALNGMAISTKRWIGEHIQKLPYVKSIHVDGKNQILDDESNTAIGAQNAWDSFNVHGEGIDISIIDTGIDYLHEALGDSAFPNSKVVGGYDFVNDDADPMDDHGHGTHVAGIASGEGPPPMNLRGVAYKAHLWAYKVLSAGGEGFDSWVIGGIERSLDPDQDPLTPTPIDVINLSLGKGWPIFVGPNDALAQAVDNAVEAGVVCVVAAGNEGSYMTINSPGCARRALTVGASNNTVIIASFSSRGAEPYTDGLNSGIKPDIVAPGVNINSAIAGGGYAIHSGTSMATPHVAGAAALLKQFQPGWTPNQIKSVLMETAKDLGEDCWTQGSGRLTVLNALKRNVILEPPSVHFGIVDSNISVWTSTKTLTLTNTGSTGQIFSMSSEMLNVPSGATLSLSPNSFFLDSGATVSVSARISVNSNVPYSEHSLMYTGKIMAKSSNNSINISVPFTFVKCHMFRVFAEETPFYLNMGRGGVIDFYSPMQNDTFCFSASLNTYVTIAGTFWDRKTKFVKDNLFYHGLKNIYLKKSDAKNKITLRCLDENGQVILRPGAWTQGLFRNDNYSQTIDCGRFFGTFGCDTYENTVDELFFPDLDSSYSIELVYQTYLPEGKQYIFPFGIKGGITSSKTLQNNPLQFKEINYVYTALNGEDNLIIHSTVQGPAGHAPYKNQMEIVLASPFKLKTFYLPPPFPNFHYKNSFQYVISPIIPYPTTHRTADVQISPPDTFKFYHTLFGNNRILSHTSLQQNLFLKLGYGIPTWVGQTNNQAQIFQILRPLTFFENPLWENYSSFPFKIYQNSSVMASGWLSNYINNSFNYTMIPDNYIFESYTTQYKVVDSLGRATIKLEFDLRKPDPNPPYFRSLKIYSDRNPGEDVYKADSTHIEFEIADDDEVQRTKVFFQPLGESNWERGTLYSDGDIFRVSSMPDLPDGYVSMRIEAIDFSGNVLDYRAEPAFFYYPVVPIAPNYLWPTNNKPDCPTLITLMWQKPNNARNATTTYHLQVAEDSNFTNCIYEFFRIPTIFSKIPSLEKGTKYFWRVRAQNISGISDYSAKWSFTTSSDSTFAFPIRERWNLISKPLLSDNNRKDNVFPTSISQAYSFSGDSYSMSDTIQNGKGYWLKFNGSDTIAVAGKQIILDTLDVNEDWNIIGSISVPVEYTNIVSIPIGLTLSQLFSYNGTYSEVQTIIPGKGYWVKASAAGKLILSSLSLSSSIEKVHIRAISELPPPPPNENISNKQLVLHKNVLNQNFPNPFNPSTVISYSLSVKSLVTLKVYNILGQEVITLLKNKEVEDGVQEVELNASKLQSGVYIYKLDVIGIENQNQNFSEVKKMLLLR